MRMWGFGGHDASIAQVVQQTKGGTKGMVRGVYEVGKEWYFGVTAGRFSRRWILQRVLRVREALGTLDYEFATQTLRLSGDHEAQPNSVMIGSGEDLRLLSCLKRIFHWDNYVLGE